MGTVLAPGGRVPNSHSHPEQEERFTVFDGMLRFRIGWRRRLARPGDVVVVPRGTVHHFANPGTTPARALVESVPALCTEAMLVTAAALARDQHAKGRRCRGRSTWPCSCAISTVKCGHPTCPPPLVRAVLRPLGRLARALGRDIRYQRLRRKSSGTQLRC